MDSSKIPQGSEECSSSESGWTMYIASPDLENGQANNEDDGEYITIDHEGFKKDEEEAAANSDDSMASDASSGPSDQRYSYGCLGFVNDKKKSVSKKHNQQKEKKKQIKGEKENSEKRGNSGGRLKKF